MRNKYFLKDKDNVEQKIKIVRQYYILSQQIE